MNENANSDRIAYWLLPEEQDARLLQTIIRQLAQRFDSPVFTPHLTLLAIASQRLADPLRSLAATTANNCPVTLEYTGTPEWTPVYNRALTLPFRPSPELERLIRDLHPDNKLPSGYQPHISLVYADLDRSAGESLIREVDPVKHLVRFDRCAAVRVGPSCRSDRDVRMWKTLATHQLTHEKNPKNAGLT